MQNKNNMNKDNDISKEDLQNLGDKVKNLRNDDGDDQSLRNRQKPVDFAGSDLDIPGRNLPENSDKRTIKDEENQLYSQGGDGNDHLETDTK